ncbi:hypothetical protein DYBT9275_05056 [Dyadobacter sp. CECT 9275]|uniref:Uncharacterized protein n=1 Tax=Dyadobacter helix TaxID=2822344 RepID=A0A916NND0_9BACT|nr:hypothetical protein DYBT9275_05056 [Dyadobacter sp. CECT 9275]
MKESLLLIIKFTKVNYIAFIWEDLIWESLKSWYY